MRGRYVRPTPKDGDEPGYCIACSTPALVRPTTFHARVLSGLACRECRVDDLRRWNAGEGRTVDNCRSGGIRLEPAP